MNVNLIWSFPPPPFLGTKKQPKKQTFEKKKEKGLK